jgi:uncharacterized membrane protein YphA (DoxX/SURF4 family)
MTLNPTVTRAPAAQREPRFGGVFTVLRTLFALAFMFAGISKLAGNAQQVHLFAQIGAGQWMRYFVGSCEVCGAIGLMIVPLRVLSSLCLTALMAGATITTLFVTHENPTAPIAFLLVAVVVARVQWLDGGPRASRSVRRAQA